MHGFDLDCDGTRAGELNFRKKENDILQAPGNLALLETRHWKGMHVVGMNFEWASGIT